jgi:mono/diheme cytochrome c family protein
VLIKTIGKPAAIAAILVSLAGHLCAAYAQAESQPGSGQRFYQKTCAKCHETGIGPVITGLGLPAVAYMTIVRSGLKEMPAFRVSDIDDATLQDLAKYLANTPPKK